MGQADTTSQHRCKIEEFIESSCGLDFDSTPENNLQIHQKMDGKSLLLKPDAIEEIIPRVDSVEKPFLQINFVSGHKILLTENLVGFKPEASEALDMGKLPRVVTTPDLVSVVEAIEESINSEEENKAEVDVLKQVFEAVLRGGEAIGFNLDRERAWVQMIAVTNLKPSA